MPNPCLSLHRCHLCTQDGKVHESDDLRDRDVPKDVADVQKSGRFAEDSD